ncbi:thiamine/thiamine pyrophosphate ABC transporter permease [Vibrio hippocampi]|uniref:Thiamine transport system permease protein ThiP n=1 Tax=Vibrio hippocampi TaxID=654686 RepID=A0ABM8ZFR8_9VIBR|nr:thiamine/thiamine pyrophosphate ABC transporter permease [Vibrio hippocampi]CAH0524541.1 hypothetical protein VHP8226_00379 [Vibrio hippocampi]
MNRTPKLGLAILLVIAVYVVTALWKLLSFSSWQDISWIIGDPYYQHVVKFSFLQASASTLLSVGLAIPVAHALSRRHFFGRDILLKLFATTLVLPVLIGVFGILAIYGQQGLLAKLFALYGTEMPFSIYGLSGILLTHVFFNLPFSARLLLTSIESVPIEQRKLASQLGMNSWQVFKFAEWPRLKQHLPHVVGLVFMLCFTSFATVMALGGGPKATTIELAIYQAIKFDFDLQTGAALALGQMLFCASLVLLLGRFHSQPQSRSHYGAVEGIFIRDSRLKKSWDSFWIMGVLVLLLPPLASIVVAGLNPKLIEVLSHEKFWHALFNSFKVALMSASLALVSGILLLQSSRHLRLQGQLNRANGVEFIGSIILVTPALVLSTATFLLFRTLSDVFSLAFVIVVLVNALMALPYVIKTLSSPMYRLAQQYTLLWQHLGIKGGSGFRLMEWRALRSSIVYAFSISFVLSLGDLTVIALFGSQDFNTLPLYLYQLLGSYQMEAAGVVSLVLFAISIGVFVIIEKISHEKGEVSGVSSNA